MKVKIYLLKRWVLESSHPTEYSQQFHAILCELYMYIFPFNLFDFCFRNWVSVSATQRQPRNEKSKISWKPAGRALANQERLHVILWSQLFLKNSAAICFLDKILTELNKNVRSYPEFHRNHFSLLFLYNGIYIFNRNHPFFQNFWKKIPMTYKVVCFSLVGILKQVWWHCVKFLHFF